VHSSVFDIVVLVYGYEQNRVCKCSVLKFIEHQTDRQTEGQTDRQAGRQLLYPAGDISVLTGQVTVLYA